LKWDEIYKVAESKNAFYLFISKNQAATIPKNALEDENEIGILKRLVKANLDGKKISFKK
jgi:hypothetical protein